MAPGPVAVAQQILQNIAARQPGIDAVVPQHPSLGVRVVQLQLQVAVCQILLRHTVGEGPVQRMLRAGCAEGYAVYCKGYRDPRPRTAVDVDDVGIDGIAGGIDIPGRHLEAEIVAVIQKVQLLMIAPARPEVEPVVAPGRRILPGSSVGAELPLPHGIIGGMLRTVAEGGLAVQLIVHIGRSECDGFRCRSGSVFICIEFDTGDRGQRIWNGLHHRSQLIIPGHVAERHPAIGAVDKALGPVSPIDRHGADTVSFGNVVDLELEPGSGWRLRSLPVSCDNHRCFGRIAHAVVPFNQTVRCNSTEGLVIVQRHAVHLVRRQHLGGQQAQQQAQAQQRGP